MTPALEFILEAKVAIGDLVDLGSGPTGGRRMVPIIGGEFQGPKFKGTILPGGADWQIVRPDGVLELDAHYILQTTDNTRIAIRNRCLRHGPSEVLAKMMRGETVSPSSYYFRTSPVFSAPTGIYDWLNRFIFVGSGERQKNQVVIRVWRVA